MLLHIGGEPARRRTGLPAFPDEFYARQNTTVRSTNRLVYLDSDFNAPNTRMMKSIGPVEFPTVYFGGGPPEKFMVHGNTRTIDWATGRPKIDADYIVCAFIQVVYGGINLTSPTACAQTTYPEPLGSSAELTDQHGLVAVLGGEELLEIVHLRHVVDRDVRTPSGSSSGSPGGTARAGKNPVFGSTFVTIGAGNTPGLRSWAMYASATRCWVAFCAKIAERYCVPSSGPCRLSCGGVLDDREVDPQELAEGHLRRGRR